MDLKLACFLPIFLWAFVTQGQNLKPTEDSNYVVIGAFSSKENAEQFTQKAKSNNYKATFALNPVRQYYYVFVTHTDNKAAAFAEAKTLRQQSPYWDTWVFNGLLGEQGKISSLSASQGDLDPTTGESIKEVKSMDSPTVVKQDQLSTDTSEGPTTNMEPQQIEPQQIEPQPTEPPLAEIEEGEKAFKFIVTAAASGEEISGAVNMVEPKSEKKLGTYEANKVVGILPPSVSSVNFECEIFGYLKEQKNLDYDNPTKTEGVILGEHNEVVIPFKMVRLKKGDKSIMYNVYFFKDAAIMRPESRTEVNSLTEMMKENPNYKIRIHGHTNGGGAGKIVGLGENKNFFSLTGAADGYGSSKKLSKVRAETIKEYLIAEGIDEKRMEIKAWGGKKNIYDKRSPQAQANVRVEIEILQD